MNNIAAILGDYFCLRAYCIGETACILFTLCVEFKTNKYTTYSVTICFQGHMAGSMVAINKHCSVAVKLKTCLWLCSHAKSLIPHICLLTSLNNVWRGILIRLGLIKELPICSTQGQSLSVHKLGRPGYLLVKLIFAWSVHNSWIVSNNLSLFTWMGAFERKYCLLSWVLITYVWAPCINHTKTESRNHRIC